MTLTADTITDEQIRGIKPKDWREERLKQVALRDGRIRPRPSDEYVRRARARFAEIINARAASR